jgi:hypothetical protein
MRLHKMKPSGPFDMVYMAERSGIAQTNAENIKEEVLHEFYKETMSGPNGFRGRENIIIIVNHIHDINRGYGGSLASASALDYAHREQRALREENEYLRTQIRKLEAINPRTPADCYKTIKEDDLLLII